MKTEVFDIERNLMKTSPDEGKVLRQNETGAVYSEAIDVIVGFREENGVKVPYGRYTYTEEDAPEKESEEE